MSDDSCALKWGNLCIEARQSKAVGGWPASFFRLGPWLAVNEGEVGRMHAALFCVARADQCKTETSGGYVQRCSPVSCNGLCIPLVTVVWKSWSLMYHLHLHCSRRVTLLGLFLTSKTTKCTVLSFSTWLPFSAMRRIAEYKCQLATNNSQDQVNVRSVLLHWQRMLHWWNRTANTISKLERKYNFKTNYKVSNKF